MMRVQTVPTIIALTILLCLMAMVAYTSYKKKDWSGFWVYAKFAIVAVVIWWIGAVYKCH